MVARSCAEAKDITIAKIFVELTWMKMILDELG